MDFCGLFYKEIQRRTVTISKLPDRVDIIVAGSGYAGLAAAIAGAEAGASVLVLEKMMAPGGNSLISDGGIAAPGTDLQIKAGIDDSPELMARDILAAGEGLNYPSLVKILAEQAENAFRWSRDCLGVRYRDQVDLFGGHSVPRCYSPHEISGRPLIDKMLNRLHQLKVPLCLGVYVDSLLQDRAGRVYGLSLRENYRSGKSARGNNHCLKANKGVIIATGGFGSDVGFRQAQDPRLSQDVMSTNRPSATAEVLRECLKLGANPVHLSRIQLGPWASPDEKGYGLGPLFGDYLVIPYGIIVDPDTGSRFTNELDNRKNLTDAILKRNHPVIGITDHRAVKLGGWDISKPINKGIVKVFDSAADLADCFGIKKASLESTMLRFNEMITAGRDLDFNKPIMANTSLFEKPPYYAMRMWPKVHHTMGGLQIDEQARAINLDQEPITGLFAAGEITGGIHGACRLGSCAIAECLVFGKIAGRAAASAG